VRGADRIVVIKDGCTVEAGTHAELLERDEGLYRMLSQSQLDLTGSPKSDAKENDSWPQTNPPAEPLIPLPRP
jgi:ABC-type glutathione transport system ATPase component